MAERPRPRLSIDATPRQQEGIKTDAQAEGVSMSRFVLDSVELRRSFDKLPEEGGITSIVLKGEQGETVLELPITLFKPFLISDPALRQHFLKQNPPKPQ